MVKVMEEWAAEDRDRDLQSTWANTGSMRPFKKGDRVRSKRTGGTAIVRKDEDQYGVVRVYWDGDVGAQYIRASMRDNLVSLDDEKVTYTLSKDQVKQLAMNGPETLAALKKLFPDAFGPELVKPKYHQRILSEDGEVLLFTISERELLPGGHVDCIKVAVGSNVDAHFTPLKESDRGYAYLTFTKKDQ